MPVSLVKGEKVSLTKEAGGSLSKVTVGLGWDPPQTAGDTYDLDASAFGLDASDHVPGDGWFIYFKQMDSPDGTIHHQGDNLTGDGDGDDEKIDIDLANLPALIEKVAITVTIYEAEKKKQNFGQVKNAYIRVCDESGAEIAKYDLGEDASLETALTFGELYRNNGEWKFNAVGAGHNDGLAGLCRQYQVQL